MKLLRNLTATASAVALAMAMSACGGGSNSPQSVGSAPSAGGETPGNPTPGNPGEAETRNMTVVVVAIDSLMPEDIDTTAMPNVSNLITNGTLYTESRSVFSAETIPNHVAMMTGVYPDRNGIPTNNFIDREALAAGTLTEAEDEDLDNPNEIEAKTLFTWIDEKCRSGAIPRNADINTAATLSKTYLYLAFQGDAADDQANDAGITNLIPDTHWDPRTSPAYIGPGSEHTPDNSTGPQAVTMLADADFHFINLGDVDRSAHASGSSGRQLTRATADGQIGDLVQSLMDDGRWEDTVFIISSDHGMDFSIATDESTVDSSTSAADLFSDPPQDAELFAGAAGNAGLNSLSTQSTVLDGLSTAACGFEPILAVQNGGTNSLVATNGEASAADRAAALFAARSCLLNFDDDDTADTPTCSAAIAAGNPAFDDAAVASCKSELSKPVNVGQIQHAWFANPDFYNGSDLIATLSSLEDAAKMPASIKSRHENLGDLVLVIADGFKFSEPDASGNPIPGNHGHMPTIHNTVIVSGGSSILNRGNTVNGTSTDHFVRDPSQAENIDIAPTVAWLLGLNIQNGDFPDAGATFEDYGDGAVRTGFDGRILSEAFNVDPLAVTPSDCGIIRE